MLNISISDLYSLMDDESETNRLERAIQLIEDNSDNFVFLNVIDGDVEKRRILKPFGIRENIWEPYKFGLMDSDYRIIVKPEYDSIIDNVFSKDDLIRVGKLTAVNYQKGTGKDDLHIRLRFGVIDSSCKTILKTEYDNIYLYKKYNLIVVTNGPTCSIQGSGLFSWAGEEIVPVGKYYKIYDFDKEMARVITFNDKWGIIGINGEVLLPPVYDRIWPFEGKDFDSARTEKNGVTIDFDFAGLRAGKYSNDYSDDLPF